MSAKETLQITKRTLKSAATTSSECYAKQNKMQEERKVEKLETVAWTPPMSVYS